MCLPLPASSFADDSPWHLVGLLRVGRKFSPNKLSGEVDVRNNQGLSTPGPITAIFWDAWSVGSAMTALLRAGFSDTDLYAVGVVLFDCLVRGTRSFALPSNSMTLPLPEALGRAAAARRAGAPRLRATHPDVPPALEAVVNDWSETLRLQREAKALRSGVEASVVRLAAST